MSDQPADLPVLTFACQIYEQKPNGQSRYRASVLCIDKRNGQTVFKKKFDNTTGIFDVAGDAAKKTVDLTMQQNTVTLTFTDKPLPPRRRRRPRRTSRRRGQSHPRRLGLDPESHRFGDDDSDKEDE